MAQGQLIPMRTLKALAKRVGYEIADLGWSDGPNVWQAAIEVSLPFPDDGTLVSARAFRGMQYVYLSGFLAKGLGKTKRAAQIQARENAKKFLECVLTMEYGEKEDE